MGLAPLFCSVRSVSHWNVEVSLMLVLRCSDGRGRCCSTVGPLRGHGWPFMEEFGGVGCVERYWHGPLQH